MAETSLIMIQSSSKSTSSRSDRQERLRHMDKPGDRSADDLDHERSSIANEEPVTVSTLLNNEAPVPRAKRDRQRNS